MSDEGKNILHGGYMRLELFARSLFGEAYFGSVSWTRWTDWKRFYIRCLRVLDASLFSSMGSVDEKHRKDIQAVLDNLEQEVKEAKSKDRMNTVLVVGLFKLVFLLLGRLPYKARGAKRNLNTFRTVSYCQTEEQLSWLLQGHIQQSAASLGFQDSFDADWAFLHWARSNKRKHADRSAYVEWVREEFPEILHMFK